MSKAEEGAVFRKVIGKLPGVADTDREISPTWKCYALDASKCSLHLVFWNLHFLLCVRTSLTTLRNTPEERTVR